MDINLINYNDIQKIRIAYNLCIKCAKPLPENSTTLKCIDCDKSLFRAQKDIREEATIYDKCEKCGKIFKYKNLSSLCYRCKIKVKRLNDKNDRKLNIINKNTKDFYLQIETEKAIEKGNYMGVNIKRIRKIQKISVAKLSENIGIKSYELVKIESGKTRICLSEFVKIYDSLNIDYSIFNLEENELYGKLYVRFKSSIVDFTITPTGNKSHTDILTIDKNTQKPKQLKQHHNKRPDTLTEKEKQISTKNFYIQLEIDQAIKTGNYMGFNIKRVRKLKKISTSNFIKSSNLKLDELYNIEKGKKEINLSQFKEIIKVLGVDSSMFGIEADEMCGKLYLRFKKTIMDFDLLK